MRNLILLVAIACLYSCKQSNKTQELNAPEDSLAQNESAVETTPQQPPAVKSNSVIENDRFHFAFDLPADWKATDKSNNGDGYFIDCGNASTDIRIYGEELKGNEFSAELELKSCDSQEEYLFANGYPGIRCLQGDEEYYYYDTPKTRIVCYVHATGSWRKANAAQINALIQSIRSGTQNYN